MHLAGRDGGKENMVNAMKRIIREEGTVGFYKGGLSSQVVDNIAHPLQVLDPRSLKVC